MALFKLLSRRRSDRRDTVAVVGLGALPGGAEADAPAEPPWLGWFDPGLGLDQSVLGWLDWPVRLSDFAGRDAELQDLLLWARTGRGVRVRWLIGPSGAGKSRLAAEAAEVLREQGWQAGFVRLDQGQLVPVSADGAFLIIDTPEEQDVAFGRFLADLAALDSVSDRPVRVLILSRAGPGDRLPPPNPYARTVFDPPLVLSPELPEGGAHILFRSAQRRVAGRAEPSGASAERLAGPPTPIPRSRFVAWYGRERANRTPLGLLAAAVETVLAPEQPLETLSGASAVLALVARERARLCEIGRQQGFGAEALARLVALAAVTGDLDHTGLRRWADPELRLGLPPRPEVVERLRRTGLLVDGVLPAPGPDLCAAGLLVTTLAEAPEQAPEWLWTALENGLAPTLARLARLAEDAETGLGLTRPRLAGWLSAMVVGRPERCRRLDRRIGERWPAAFTGVAVSVANTLALDGTNQAEQADQYARLCDALMRLGDADGALDAADRSLALWRRLAAQDPDSHAPRFADTCDRRARALAGLGDWVGAAALAAEAVTARRRLAARNRSAVGVYAESLGLSALCQAKSTCPGSAEDRAAAAETALAASETAVALARVAGAEDAQAARYRLGVALDRLCQVSRLTGSHAEADAVLAEADALWQLLERDAPGRFTRPPP